MSAFQLPPAPVSIQVPVKAWSEPVVIPTYRPLPGDRNPMFLETRVYQGSSGRVYPLPFCDRISDQLTHDSWQAIHIENEFVRLMVLPQLGGRIHVGLDKTNNYDFVYRQNVIKPALVGLAGPWASGGIEFNWPQHHRPSTYMSTDCHIEYHDDQSVTVWCSEHEPMNRMKGMHGICLHPGKSYVELKVRLYNRTALTQTFLWWANVAIQVHENYQSFFPADVSHVADHAKRAISQFPLATASYYGIDYGRRASKGVNAAEKPAHFVPPTGLYPPNDLGWYANIPVPTSYMAMGSRQDFFGGYDFEANGGIVHVANRHIAPGKKQWTWGNHGFGYAWDRQLTHADANGIFPPYIELMAGVYTDNQPDFSYLAAGETRTFSQFWYPIQKIGPARQANIHASLSLGLRGNQVQLGVAVTSQLDAANIQLERQGEMIAQWTADLAPNSPFIHATELPAGTLDSELALTVYDKQNSLIIQYQPTTPPAQNAEANIAHEPAGPRDIASLDELYRIGLHLQQYRHATRSPEPYWIEALRRDPTDSRCQNAMGLSHYRRGEFAIAAEHFKAAIASLTKLNPNPMDGEPFYNLGLALRWLGDQQGAYDAFYKATWNYSWQSPAFYALAQIDGCRGQWEVALEHLNRVLRVNVEHLQARNFKASVLQKLGQVGGAEKIVRQTLALDPLDCGAIYLLNQSPPEDAQIQLDLALDLSMSGCKNEALALLAEPALVQHGGSGPLRHYYRADLFKERGDFAAAECELDAAEKAGGDYCFPSRLAEIGILRRALESRPRDVIAAQSLANLFYDRRRYEEAIVLWEVVVQVDPLHATAWRNLGIAYFNIRQDAAGAKLAYDHAALADPQDARILYERDQLWKRVGEPPARRITELETRLPIVRRRDDLCVELCTIYNHLGRHQEAADLLAGRQFQPWEGGEGLVLAQHVKSQLGLGRAALNVQDWTTALKHFEFASSIPLNLGEGRHLLANKSDVDYWLGVACAKAGNLADAHEHWKRAAQARGDFQEMGVQAYSEMTFWSALALRSLQQEDSAKSLLYDLQQFAITLEKAPCKVDYFATSLPTMLLFNDDVQRRQTIRARFIRAQAELGLGLYESARVLFQNVLQMDPNHSAGAEFLNFFVPEAEGKK